MLANKKVDEGSTGNIGTDGEDCVSVLSAVTAQARHLPVRPALKRSPPKRLVSDTSLDVGGHIATAATGHPDKTTTVPSCSNVDVSTDGKWMTRKRRRVGKTVKTNDCLVDKSLVDSQTNPPKSHNKASSNIVKTVNTVSKEARPLPSLITWNREESKDNDPAGRHAHDLQLLESVVRNVLHEEVSGVNVTKVIRLGKPIPCVQEHKDLGVVLSHDLKTTTRCKAATVKGFCALWSLRRPFKFFDEETFRILYPTYIRPHLEYCIQAASPCLVKDTNSLECVQRVGTKLVKGPSRLPYGERLKRLNLFPLSYRRTRCDLILAFRIFNYDLDVNMSYLFAPSSTNDLQGHSKKVRKPRSNKLKVRSGFSHRVVNHWNALPEQVVSAPSVNTFKEKLDLHRKAMCQD
ncbi:unnamed protein product [Schistosoma curassoni]|uniref:Reverse transcriptase n=1 Tax=Schistosoma curassoni TaxID=6186 RepID=A0A183KXE8_9TREM|nr:unnamed protein product [Schistosoma curassoni]